tara:strand:- start:903 stop:1157 length:255 start_codon:yes stop_codon:yes gene_type:complete
LTKEQKPIPCAESLLMITVFFSVRNGIKCAKERNLVESKLIKVITITLVRVVDLEVIDKEKKKKLKYVSMITQISLFSIHVNKP